jgi:hypothetical protein
MGAKAKRNSGSVNNSGFIVVRAAELSWKSQRDLKPPPIGCSLRPSGPATRLARSFSHVLVEARHRPAPQVKPAANAGSST